MAGGGSNVWAQMASQLAAQSTQKMQQGGQNQGATPPPGQAPQQQGALNQILNQLINKITTKQEAEIKPPTADDLAKQKNKQAASMMGRLSASEGGEATLAPEPEKREPKKKTTPLSERVANTFDYAASGLRAMHDPDRMVKEAQAQRAAGEGGGFKESFGHFLRAARNRSELGSMGDMFSGAGAAAGGIPVVGKPIESFMKLTDVVIKSVDALKRWGDHLHHANIQFAEFSGAMTKVMVEQEIRDMQLSRERGNRRAGAAKDQAEAKSRLDRFLAPYEDLIGNVKNSISAALNNALASAQGIEPEWLKKLIGREPPVDRGVGLAAWMANHRMGGRDDWAKWNGRPGRFDRDPRD